MNALAEQPHVDLQRLRHSTAHVLAQAVTETFPGTKLGIGPAIEDGFYYDIDPPRPLSEDDFGAIEARMREIIAADEPLVRRVLSPAEARAQFRDQPYKLELIDELEMQGAVISTYRQGAFEDLCRGPHLHSTGEIPADGFRLMHVAGAYWRGDERRPMLQRVYGTAWVSREDLDEHLWRLQEAKRRDHRLIGRDLDLFSISDAVGPGLVLWHPRGTALRMAAEDYLRNAVQEAGYQFVATTHIGRGQLWATSGHLDFFGESMYAPMEMDGQEYYVKPMNCPFHAEIFKSRPRSYRDLPIRLAENGTVYRYERSGVLHGLARPRGFTQDDSHIFCRPEDVDEEIEGAVRLALSVLHAFGLTDYSFELSTKPDKAVGSDEDWDWATQALRLVLERLGLSWRLDEGGGAFYGPKISLQLQDAIGREWQGGTIQFDFNLPERFDLTYTGGDGKPHRPYMVHRALMGSVERFMAVLIEHYAGAFPLWLAPVQAAVIPVSNQRHLAYAESLGERLRAEGFRVEVDVANERMQAKIRRAQLEKVPYMLIAGNREMAEGSVSVRARDQGEIGSLSVGDLLTRMRDEISASRRANDGNGGVWNTRCC
jgi:threonyl-tRNA synthetase